MHLNNKSYAFECVQMDSSNSTRIIKLMCCCTSQDWQTLFSATTKKNWSGNARLIKITELTRASTNFIIFLHMLQQSACLGISFGTKSNMHAAITQHILYGCTCMCLCVCMKDQLLWGALTYAVDVCVIVCQSTHVRMSGTYMPNIIHVFLCLYKNCKPRIIL